MLPHQQVLDSNAGTDLEGLPGPVNVPGTSPLHFHGHRDIQRLANEYNARNGLNAHPAQYTPVDPAKGAQVAQAYEEMQHDPDNPHVRASYNALKGEVAAQYAHAKTNGYNFEFYPQDRDPYPNSPREAVLDLHHNKHMYVYPTSEGYGMDENPTNHPMLEDSGERWNGQPVTYNDQFRAIHDFYGHAKEGLGFRANGEDNAYRQHAAMFSPLAQQALATETRGQNSYVNYGPNGMTNQTAGQADTVFAPQKAGLMPQWATDPNLHQQSDWTHPEMEPAQPQQVQAAYDWAQHGNPALMPAQHNMTWQPGTPGKGFILTNGSVWNWPTEGMRPQHMNMAQKVKHMGLQVKPNSAFHIEPQGRLWNYNAPGTMDFEKRKLDNSDRYLINNVTTGHGMWFGDPGDSPPAPVQDDGYGHAVNLAPPTQAPQTVMAALCRVCRGRPYIACPGCMK